jgi:RNA polymerase sigma-70 factor (ECF subfamily)
MDPRPHSPPAARPPQSPESARPLDDVAPAPGDSSSSTNASDAALLARVVAGDADAVGTLYDRHGATCYGLALAIVHGASDADDVVASTFAQLWRTAARFDPERGSVAAWITTMTRTRALDLLRAQKRRSRLHERAAADDDAGFAVPVGGSGDAPDLDTERREIAVAVRASLATLPEAQRRAIELAFFGGLSHTDVAAALGQPLGTIKTRIRTGLLRLRESLRPVLAGEGA